MISKENNISPLSGLVLAGGKSTRMGTDKDLMKWYGKEQRYYTSDLLQPFCKEVFISCRAEQARNIDAGYQALPDTFLNMGPMGGILSALRFDRDKAWIVIACDLPLVNEKVLQHLVENRKGDKLATAYKSPTDGLPEPLITIWEPTSYGVLLSFLGRGISCPRKVLMNSDIHLIESPQPETLLNVNTQAEAAQAKDLIEKRSTHVKR